jgi:hypothetical protein
VLKSSVFQQSLQVCAQPYVSRILSGFLWMGAARSLNTSRASRLLLR